MSLREAAATFRSEFGIRFRKMNCQGSHVKTLRVTNNPLQKDDYAFAEIEAGESIRILAKYTYHGDLWYIECTVDGQPARGFIDRQTSGFVLGE